MLRYQTWQKYTKRRKEPRRDLFPKLVSVVNDGAQEESLKDSGEWSWTLLEDLHDGDGDLLEDLALVELAALQVIALDEDGIYLSLKRLKDNDPNDYNSKKGNKSSTLWNVISYRLYQGRVIGSVALWLV